MNDDPASPSSDAVRSLRHELRTPINHIVNYSELLLEEAGDRGATAAVAPLEAIRAAGQQALALINELLDPRRATGDAPDFLLKGSALDTLLDCVGEQCTQLQEQCRTLGYETFINDLQKIDSAARGLRALVNEHLRVPPSAHAAAADVRAYAGASQLLEPASPTRPATEPPAAPGTALGTLLVVDDNEQNRDVLARRLTRLGYSVLMAENGLQALAELEDTDVDLVLLDIQMPEMNGYEVLERRRADPRLRDIPVIMISASDALGDVVRCIEMGAEDYLTKPFNQVLLRARIGACLEKKRLRDQEKAHLATIEQQAAELAAWNRTLEERVQRQVEELERVGRLRRFLSPQLAEAILTSGDEKILEPHRREITVVFSDLRGYTEFTHNAEPEEVMRVLGEYHAAMGELIHRFLGTIEHFAGDGLMVFFNDPLEVEDAPMQATQMALAMRERAAELRRTWRRRGHKLEFGVGIDMGYATCGRIGFEGRFDYGAIGTVTNLASRLCDAASAGQILASEKVYMAVEDAVEAEPVGELTLKGFTSPVPAYNILGLLPTPPAG